MKRLGVFLGLTLLLTTTSCNILSVSEGGIEADKTIKNLPSYEIVYSQK